jgi:hypothetical protein
MEKFVDKIRQAKKEAIKNYFLKHLASLKGLSV